jgi:hypothetical protein
MDIWDTLNIPFMTLYKIDLVVVQYGYKVELGDDYWWIHSVSIFNKLHQTIFDNGKGQFWPYVRWVCRGSEWL